MNRVEISGRVTRDPEVKYLGNARFPVLSMNVAVDNASGRYNRETQKTEYESGFYQVEVAGAYGEWLGSWVQRGDEIYVVGSLSQFTRQGKDGGESTSHTRIKGTAVQVLAPPRQPQRIEPPREPMHDAWSSPGQDAGTF